jgi:type IV pilus assembly protein PilE
MTRLLCSPSASELIAVSIQPVRASHPARRKGRGRSCAAGFTLIELMIVVLMVSILATIAVPSYSQYLTRGRLSEVLTDLSAFRLRMELAYQDNGNFGVGACAVTPAAKEGFNFACVIESAGQGYTMTATGTGRNAGYAYSIDDRGERRTLSFPGAEAAACWMIRAGACS